MPTCLGMARRLFHAFCRNERGTIALVFGLVLPLLFGAVAASTEYARVISRRAQLQTAADMAALGAGRELVLANWGDAALESAAKAIAVSQLGGGAGAADARIVSAIINNRSAVQVTITENIKFMMGEVVGWPSVDVKVAAVAKRTGRGGNVCVLALDPSAKSAILLDKSARITADRCGIYSDSKDHKGIQALQSSYAKADRICSAGGYEGKVGINLTPTPTTDCPQLGDPLKGRAAPSVPASCKETNKVVSGTAETLWPGRYCGGLRVSNGGTAQLMPGEYVIDNGPLVVDTNSTLKGEYVGFYFYGNGAVLDFAADTTINLSAPKTESLAGILFFEDRAAPLLRTFQVMSNNARKLLGTIYLPQGKLFIGANAPVSAEAAYTVVIARQVALDAGPDLVLNSNYGATDVPLPKGVESLGSDIVLSQ